MLSAISAVVMILLFLVIIAASYVIYSFGVYRLMVAEGLEDRYRAWIPFWNSYVYGEILEFETEGFAITFPGVTKWIVCLYPLAVVVPGVGELAVAVGAIYVLILSVALANKYNTVPSMLISSIFSLSGIGFCFLASEMQRRCPNRKMRYGSNNSYAKYSSYSSYGAADESETGFGFDEGNAKDVAFEEHEEQAPEPEASPEPEAVLEPEAVSEVEAAPETEVIPEPEQSLEPEAAPAPEEALEPEQEPEAKE